MEAEEENEELFTRIWNLREEIISLSHLDQITHSELLSTSLELYQKEKEEKESLINQIKFNLLSQLGNK